MCVCEGVESVCVLCVCVRRRCVGGCLFHIEFAISIKKNTNLSYGSKVMSTPVSYLLIDIYMKKTLMQHREMEKREYVPY